MFFITVPLYSYSIQSTGTGKNRDEARQQAEQNLANSIYAQISSISQIESVDTGSKSSSSNQLTTTQIHYNDVTLLGVREQYENGQNGIIVCTLIIPETEVSNYEDQALLFYNDVKELNAQRLSSQNRSEQISIDIRLLGKIRQYTSCMITARQLGSVKQFPNLPISYESLSLEYEQLIPYYTDSEIQAITENSQEALAQIKADREAMRLQETRMRTEKEQEAVYLQQKLTAQAKEQLIKDTRKAQEIIENLPVLNASQLEKSFDVIEEKRKSYLNEMNIWNTQYTQLEAEQKKIAEVQSQQILDKSWTVAETENGIPTEEAKGIREKQAKYVYDTYIKNGEKELSDIRNQQRSIQDKYVDEITNDLDTLRQTNFAMNNKDKSSLSYSVDAFNGKTHAWIIHVAITIADKPISFDVPVTDVEILGKDAPNIYDIAEYDAYNYKIDELNAFLVTTPTPFIINAKFNVWGSLEHSNMSIGNFELGIRLSTTPDVVIKTVQIAPETADTFTIAITPDIPVYSQNEIDKKKKVEAEQQKKEKKKVDYIAMYGEIPFFTFSPSLGLGSIYEFLGGYIDFSIDMKIQNAFAFHSSVVGVFQIGEKQITGVASSRQNQNYSFVGGVRYYSPPRSISFYCTLGGFLGTHVGLDYSTTSSYDSSTYSQSQESSFVAGGYGDCGIVFWTPLRLNTIVFHPYVQISVLYGNDFSSINGCVGCSMYFD